MPIYEYRCHDCKRRVSILWRSLAEAETGEPRCPRCGGANLTRLVSRVAVLRSEEARLDSLMDADSLGDLDENDPRSMAKMLKKLGPELGEDFPGEVDQMIEEAMEGEAREEEGSPGEEDFD